MVTSYPFNHHPCWANNRDALWERIHLPVAARCNVKCAFCDQGLTVSCHLSKPGAAVQIMKPNDAIKRVLQELRKRPSLRIVAIAGPGEPLANKQTFDTLAGIRGLNPNLKFCLSTNGVLLQESANILRRLGVNTITVSVSACEPETASKIYEWANFNGTRLQGLEMARKIIDSQILGIKAAVNYGIRVKANSILIPGVNENEMIHVARILADAGVSIQNIMPLYPFANMKNIRAPTMDELHLARREASRFLPQFLHCKQCRSDVVGIPGSDSVL